MSTPDASSSPSPIPSPSPSPIPGPGPGPGLALDAGGTECRWALCRSPELAAETGTIKPLSGADLHDETGRARIFERLLPLARVLAGGPMPAAVWVGITGLDPELAPRMAHLVGRALHLDAARVRVLGDVEMACRACFEPGAGMLLYAGTGSIAGHVDAQGQWHRAGGRGVLIDDAGGGHWIATRALRAVWRAEDLRPGAWRDSPMARRIFERLGGEDFALTRRFLVQADRGEVGRLALAVAEAAEADPAARALLLAAGGELARLVQALHARFGALPLVLAGRVWDLHPAVREGLEAAHPPARQAERLQVPVAVAAARRAARG